MNTIFKIGDSHYEVEGTGQKAIQALRDSLPRHRFHRIILVAFKNPETEDLIYPIIQSSRKK